MKFRSVLLATLCAGAVFGQACAQVLLNEDFQDGGAEGWSGDAGRGSLELTEYAGNVSMRLTRDASIFRPVGLGGASRVKVSADFAAMGLEGDDACALEFSDNGQSWVLVGEVTDGQDDGLTLHSVSAEIAVTGGSEVGFIGARIKANADNDICWVDNIRIVATPSVDELTSDISQATFLAGEVPPKPYATKAFTPPLNATPPAKSVQGVLRFTGEAADRFQLLRDDFNYAPGSDSLKKLPPVEIKFVQNGTDLIPAIRGPRRGEHPDWEWIVEPGRVWRLDNGAVQASFPFSLQERNANCIHNGLAAFQIDADGKTSNLVYQIGSETCAYMQFDLWGAGAASFDHIPITQADVVIKNYAEERENRLPRRDISELSVTGEGAFGAQQEVRPEDMTVYGFIADDVHYVSACPTRYGDYPYCDSLVLPSYSWAKSLVAGITAMRMEKLYPGMMTQHIADYVPACNNATWKSVTFAHALNMTSGVYNSDTYDQDEASPEMRRFFLAETHAEKMNIACTEFSRKGTPGEKFVYRTADTYILGAAMNAYLREQTGDQKADFYGDLLTPMWTKLGLSPLAQQTRRTRDAAAQPFTGWGLSLHRNDIALLTRFLQHGGVIDGMSMLDEGMLNAALQKDAYDRGMPAVIDAQRYKNGFWAWNAGPAIGCKSDLWIPAMSGFGGLSAALMPNGSTYYYVSDGGAYAWRRAAEASNQLDPFCEGKQ